MATAAKDRLAATWPMACCEWAGRKVGKQAWHSEWGPDLRHTQAPAGAAMHAHTCHTAAAGVSCCRCSGARLQPHHGGGASNGGQLILGDGLQDEERPKDCEW